MKHNKTGKIGAMCAIGGSILLLAGTLLHPMEADPADALAAFTEYAADHHWIASHLTQLAGVTLMVFALISLSQLLRESQGEIWSRLGYGAAIAGLGVAAALQAVDGIALKSMVNAWVAAPPAQKDAVFQAAFAVRQIEIGLAAMLSLVLGLAASLYGIAISKAKKYPAWLAFLACLGGPSTMVAGVVIAYTGFSETAMTVNMPANILLLVWMALLGVFMWRRG
ncbi:MAG TPA: hypothetical protein VJ652_01920 [Noviherbaspirillum sp.]|nr:hypothetical protein [Noviherbaspirillum sp.]